MKWPDDYIPEGFLPYHIEYAGIIFNCDCREILPKMPKVDLVLTDPPYGMNFISNHRFKKHKAIIGDDMIPLDIIKESIIKARYAAYIFCRWDNLKELDKPRSVLAWVKNNWSMGDLKHEHGRQWEAICFYPGEDHEFIERIPDVIRANRTGNELHPTQKPVNLIKKLIGSNIGDIIFDPFLGSGTTAVAAKELGRKFIGIEISEEYCKIAVKRLRQGVLEFD